jgi:hypothetical protein
VDYISVSRARLAVGDRTFVIAAIVGCVSAFVVLLVVVSGGGVRHSQIFLPEKIEQTLVFMEIDGKTALVGTKGIAQVNPSLIMRTGDFAMEITVINEDDRAHMMFIDGLNISTRVLLPGDTDVITFYSKGEATYNYYDWLSEDREPIGQIRAMKVTALD